VIARVRVVATALAMVCVYVGAREQALGRDWGQARAALIVAALVVAAGYGHDRITYLHLRTLGDGPDPDDEWKQIALSRVEEIALLRARINQHVCEPQVTPTEALRTIDTENET